MLHAAKIILGRGTYKITHKEITRGVALGQKPLRCDLLGHGLSGMRAHPIHPRCLPCGFPLTAIARSDPDSIGVSVTLP